VEGAPRFWSHCLKRESEHELGEYGLCDGLTGWPMFRVTRDEEQHLGLGCFGDVTARRAGTKVKGVLGRNPSDGRRNMRV
jgi:hypothetical protein